MAFSIRLSAQEKTLAESYAKLHALTLGDAFKKALFEKIEDEYDLKVYEDSYSQYIASGKKSQPISKLWNELEI